MQIFVGNVGNSTEKEIKALFEEFGAVSSVKLAVDAFSRRSRGFGFVEMEQANAEKAIAGLNNTMLNFQSIVVNEAKQKDKGFRYIAVKGDKHA